MNPHPIHLSLFTEPATQPLPTEAVDSAATFRAYLQQHHLDLFTVAHQAGVRCMTVWNISRGIPVRAAHATCIRASLYRLTQVPYTAPIALLALDLPLSYRLQSSRTGGR